MDTDQAQRPAPMRLSELAMRASQMATDITTEVAIETARLNQLPDAAWVTGHIDAAATRLVSRLDAALPLDGADAWVITRELARVLLFVTYSAIHEAGRLARAAAQKPDAPPADGEA
jgi:hypothetical protein